MEKSRRRAMRKRLPRRKGHSSVLGAIHPWGGQEEEEKEEEEKWVVRS